MSGTDRPTAPRLHRGDPSAPRFRVLQERDTMVAMPDGVRLAVDVFRPDTSERVPALIAVSPYGKDVQHMGVPQQPAHSITFDHSVEAGNVDFFVSRGFAMVIGDLRGTGKSEGGWWGFYNGRDQADTAALVEWAAAQPWCDGNVGMSGHSYYGGMQMLTAAQQPPHLRAIAPIEFFPSLYEKAYPGGITSAWYAFVLKMSIPHTQILEADHRWAADELARRIRERLAEPDVATNSFFVREFNAPRRNAAFVDQLLHPTWDDFWDERSIRPKHPRIAVPVFMGSFWGYYGLIDGAFEAFTDPAIRGPKRLAILSYGTSGAKLPLRLYDEELLRWYDHWLKGIDTGVLEEPPLRLYIPGRNVVRDEREWPLARTEWTRLFLRRYEELDWTPEPDTAEPDAFVHLPPQISVKMPSLQWRTAPFQRGMEITGPVELTLYASIDATDASFVAGLYDVAPDGRRTVLTKGYLRASHRAVDEAASSVGRPRHPHTDPQPVTPGEVVEYRIGFSVMSNWFAPGHRLALEIASTDSVVLPESSGMGAVVEDKMNAMGILPGSRLVYYRIHRDRERPSSLLLPVIPE